MRSQEARAASEALAARALSEATAQAALSEDERKTEAAAEAKRQLEAEQKADGRAKAATLVGPQNSLELDPIRL